MNVWITWSSLCTVTVAPGGTVKAVVGVSLGDC